MKNRRNSLVLATCVLWGLTACASTPAEEGPATESKEPVRETQNPEAPPFGNPRPKIRPKDVSAPDQEEE